jgi:hypothetical protein
MSAPKKAPAKDGKGKGTKRKVSPYPPVPCELHNLTCTSKAEDKQEAKSGKKSKAKK